MTPRDYQQKGFDHVFKRISEGAKRICVAAPTGSGKTLLMNMILQECVRRDWKASLYTHRSVLIPQLSDGLSKMGITHGIRASGYEAYRDRKVQVSMFQTEKARCFTRPQWSLHQARLVLIDEAHGYTATTTQKIVDHHVNNGACVIGFTATPVDLWHMFDELSVLTTNSHLRACGAHLPCAEYAPDEPDLKGVRRTKVGEYVEADVHKAIMVPSVFGRVKTHYDRVNPFKLPAILFGPSVEGSKFFCDEFNAAGVAAAHVDAKMIYRGVDPKSGQPIVEASNNRNRQNLFDQVRNGEVKVLCNRFVLTEGLDLPELHVAILATTFGSVKMFLQAAGRLLRAHPSMSDVCLLDHGGNVWRHGSINADREWHVEQTSQEIREERQEKLENGEEDIMGITCPKCHFIRLSGPKCPQCGHAHNKTCRHVVQLDGTLKKVHGSPVKKKKIEPEGAKRWEKVYWPCSKSQKSRAMTWNQMWARFQKDNRDLMPHVGLDQHGRERLMVVDTETFRTVPLKFHPPIGDTYAWSQKVRDTSMNELLK